MNNWNDLPDEVVTASSVNAFKSRVDKFWDNELKIYDRVGDHVESLSLTAK